MQFPVYPMKLRRLAQGVIKARYVLLPMFVIGTIMFFIGWEYKNNNLLIAGVLIGTAGAMLFATFGANNALTSVAIKEDGIFLLDVKGNVLRSTEYRYVRSMETRMLQVTEVSSIGRRSGLFSDPTRGIEERFILVYFDAAHCFDDLKLSQISRKRRELYWCNELLYHRSCIVFLYDEDAWSLLQERTREHPAFA